MDDFAALFTYMVLALTVVSFAALAGFIVWDAIVDRRQSRHSIARREELGLPRQPQQAPLPRDWAQPSRAA